MSGGVGRGETPHHRAVRDAVDTFVRFHGRKRGLYLAAQAIGMGERAARHVYEGSEFAADEARAAAANKARIDLLAEQLIIISAEMTQVAENRGFNVREVLRRLPALAGAALVRARAKRNRRVAPAAGLVTP